LLGTSALHVPFAAPGTDTCARNHVAEDGAQLMSDLTCLQGADAASLRQAAHVYGN
jgi:hypothetical protein